MNINHRVRALLLTPRGTLLLVKRVREGVEPYYVAPGGGVETSDADLHAALRRELAEELGGRAEILAEVLRTEHPGKNDLEGWTVRHHFFVCRLIEYDLSQRSGPEFLDPAKGQYLIEEFPLEATAFATLNILPPELRDFLTANLTLLRENQ